MHAATPQYSALLVNLNCMPLMCVQLLSVPNRPLHAAPVLHAVLHAYGAMLPDIPLKPPRQYSDML